MIESDICYRHNDFRVTDLSILINKNGPRQYDLYLSHYNAPIAHYRFEDEQLANKVYEDIFQRIAKSNPLNAVDVAYNYVLFQSETEGYSGRVTKFREGGTQSGVSYDIPTYEPGS